MSSFLRILDYNYPFKSNVDVSASSSNAEFPSSNLTKTFRSKVWRSSGNYEITSTNNLIDFKESGGGSELTATLTEGRYTASELATHIKSELESASANARTYTVTHSSVTGKFTIQGQVFLSLLFSTGTNAAGSARNVLGYGTNDFTGNTSYTSPSASFHTDEWVLIDLKSAEEIDTFAVVFDPRFGIKLSENAVVTLQANSADSWDTPLYSQALSIDNTWSSIFLYLTAAQEYRFWRLKIVDSQNAYGYIELGTIMLGKSRDIGRCPDNGFTLGIIDQTKIDKNAYGNVYADLYPIKKTLSFDFNIIDYDTKKSIEESYTLAGVHTPILVSLDPNETLFDKDDFLIYGKYDKDIQYKHVVRSYFSTGIQIEEVF